MIKIKEKKDCSGCAACAQVCPKNCITMCQDEEGFLYPKVAEEVCVECGLCEKTCPIIQRNCPSNEEKVAALVQCKDKNILRESTSGGFFTVLASYILKLQGVVFGAAFDDEFVVRHCSVSTVEELYKFRNSKYVQSEVGDTYKECKQLLDAGKWVCYSGTPCQIAGLKSYLQKEYSRLITVDFICRGVPSPTIFREYLRENKIEEIESIKFRDKKYGYYASTMTLNKKDGSCISRDLHNDTMLALFYGSYISRPSCYSCVFREEERVSDFTLFDCWHGNKYLPGIKMNFGVTAVVIRNQKSKEIFEQLKNDMEYSYVAYSLLAQGDGYYMTHSISAHPRRTELFKDFKEHHSVLRLREKYLKRTKIMRIKACIKKLLMKLKLFDKYMRLKMR